MSEYQDELDALLGQVSQFSPTPSVNSNSSSLGMKVRNFWNKIWSNPYFEYVLYAIIPVIIFVILFFLKPSIVTVEEARDNGETLRLDWKKISFWSVGLAIPLIVGVYIFMRKRKIE